ncbi:hypothetical protein ACIQMJ_25825 [Actinosynnema sp. NPDC091369]
MADKRNYTEATKSALFALSTKCYFPECQQPTVTFFGKSPKKNVQIAHIRAISPNGPRYNPPGYPSLTAEQRNEFSNLLLLCDFHHPIVDKKENEKIYSVKLLNEWKLKIEKDIRSKVDGLDSLTEPRLNRMLTTAAKQTKNEITDAIRELSEVSSGAAKVLASLFEKIQGHYLDRESIDRLEAASHRLSYLEEGSSKLYWASNTLGDLEASSSKLYWVAEQLGNLESSSNKLQWAADNLGNFGQHVSRLEQAISDYERAIRNTPEPPDISYAVNQASKLLIARIDERVSNIDIGEPPVVVNHPQRWKYALWGFLTGVFVVTVAVVTAYNAGRI